MKVSQKVSFLLGVALFVSLATACASSTQQTGGGNAGEPYKLTFLTLGDNSAQPLQPNDRIIAEINKRLGIQLNVQIVPQNAAEKINVAMASGDLPDVVSTNFPADTVSQWINEGILIPLNDYMKSMPSVQKQINDHQLQWTAVNGKYYGYPYVETKTNTTLTYRADWLDRLGVQPPKTLDELYQDMKLAVSTDPDGTGKTIYGFTAQKPSGTGIIGDFDFVFYAYGLPYGDYELDASGHVIPKFEHPAFKQGMMYLKKLWDNKLIDPEFMLNDTQMKEQKLYQGRVAFESNALFRNYSRIDTSLKNVNPNGKLGFMDPPAGPDGKRGMTAAKKGGLFTAVTSASKNPAKAAQFIEFLVSPEGRDLLEKGIEGVHYTKQGDKIVYNEQERAKDGFAANGWSHPLAWGNVSWPLGEMYLPDTEPSRELDLQSVDVASRNIVPDLIPTTPSKELEYGGVVNALYNQYFMDMLTGKIDIDKGISELSQKWRQQGGDQILKEVSDMYQKNKK